MAFFATDRYRLTDVGKWHWLALSYKGEKGHLYLDGLKGYFNEGEAVDKVVRFK